MSKYSLHGRNCKMCLQIVNNPNPCVYFSQACRHCNAQEMTALLKKNIADYSKELLSLQSMENIQIEDQLEFFKSIISEIDTVESSKDFISKLSPYFDPELINGTFIDILSNFI